MTSKGTNNQRKAHAYNERSEDHIPSQRNSSRDDSGVEDSHGTVVLKFHFEYVNTVDQRAEEEAGEEDEDEELEIIFLNFYLYSSSANPMDVSSAELFKQLTKLKSGSIESLEKY